jgi:GTP cyclohydrolase I
VEDLVRSVAARAEQDSRIRWYRVEAENFESIHNHNAYALIEKAEEPPVRPRGSRLGKTRSRKSL